MPMNKTQEEKSTVALVPAGSYDQPEVDRAVRRGLELLGGISRFVKPEENILHLRMFAPMDGKDPLDIGSDASGGAAANYIRTHTKRATFEAGVGRDMLEIISELS